VHASVYSITMALLSGENKESHENLTEMSIFRLRFELGIFPKQSCDVDHFILRFSETIYFHSIMFSFLGWFQILICFLFVYPLFIPFLLVSSGFIILVV
jgi:hypothetical protein